MADAIRYQWTGAAMLRATTDPSPADIPQGLNLDDAVSTRAWLVRIWQRPDVRNALITASPVLSQTVESIVCGTPAPPRQIRRAALSVVSYLLRWRQRPTPFGLFAGTASLTVGTAPQVRWGHDHPVRLRADGEWISDVIQHLENDAELLERLLVVANNTAYIRGDRLAAPGPPADGHARLMAPVEISMRLTRPVKAAMHAARTPIRYQDLRDHLTALFPAGAGGKIDEVLRELLTQNLLITSLRPPMTTIDALDHVCAELKKADAHSLPDVGPYARSLYDLRDDLASHDEPAASTNLQALTTRMATRSAIAPVPVLVDTVLNGSVHLPTDVVTEAQSAVAVMHRLSPLPYGYHHWRDYHRRFRAQYGAGATVPVLDLVADSGLGWPAGYIGSERRKAPTLLTDRDAVILRLLQQTGHGDLVLDEPTITELVEAAGIDEPLYGDRCELGFEVHAPSTRALVQGEFSIEITSVPRPGSSMLGRFAHLLPADQERLIADSYTTRPDAVTAQLSFGPRRRRNENVARAPQLLPCVIPLAEHPVEGAASIALDDIGVTADARSLHLVQLSTGRPIDARVLHALEAGIQTPPLARFLSEVAGARHAAYKPFDFGAASRLPYLPRVRYGRTTLAPARWLLDNRGMPGRTAPHNDWEKAFTAWRVRMNVARYVCLMEYDQRLPLDLDHPVHRRLVRSQMYEGPGLELRQAADPDAHGWIGRAHDVVLPFVRTTTNRSLPALRPHQDIEVPIQLPGAGSVLQMHLHAHPDRFDEILDRHLPGLLAALETGATWWFTRHRQLARPETGQHLTLNLHIVPAEHAAVAATVNRWATELHHQRLLARLTLEPYRPQTGRYGARTAMDAAHDVFATDSAAALAQIRLTSRTHITPQAVTAASLVDLATHFLPSAEDAWRWLIENTPAHGRPDRTHRAEALQLYAAQGGTDLSEAWTGRGRSLATYRQALTAEQHDPGTVLRSLLHQHHVRALGVDPTVEAATLHLARTVALRHQPIKAAR
ncbi:lantibiotic dehydratase [Streptomyces sp. NPDC005407]|uniref:lantibiotic dehydratase n=1 Tax=Streptomyces sp. NPDC005407 TaxID=3155340 RepID=UPI0033BF1B52